MSDAPMWWVACASVRIWLGLGWGDGPGGRGGGGGRMWILGSVLWSCGLCSCWAVFLAMVSAM